MIPGASPLVNALGFVFDNDISFARVARVLTVAAAQQRSRDGVCVNYYYYTRPRRCANKNGLLFNPRGGLFLRRKR